MHLRGVGGEVGDPRAAGDAVLAVRTPCIPVLLSKLRQKPPLRAERITRKSIGRQSVRGGRIALVPG